MSNTNKMDFSYKKNDNASLFTTLVEEGLLNVREPQNYVPLYANFFTLTKTNHNSINLNNPLSLHTISGKESDNRFIGQVIDISNVLREKKVFFKLSPLLDPIKYLVGKYDLSNTNLLKLPLFENTESHPKVRDPNNSAYIDSFFTYLSSQLLHRHGFIHGLDFYGSFLAIKKDYAINVADDLEYLHESQFFHRNRGVLFELDNTFQTELMNYDTRNYKAKLEVGEKADVELTLSNIEDLKDVEAMFSTKEAVGDNEEDPALLYEGSMKGGQNSAKKTGSTCSSRSSNTDQDGESCSEDSDDDQGTQSECSTATEDEVNATLPEFPVQVISLEQCHKTLDSLIIHSRLSDKEWGSIVTQILMILITFQKTFGLTHNDLHTNNIMYIETERHNIYYKVDGRHYKVPTFGRIFKIIDFGRAIYKFRGNVICSDSFHPKGDAATQYNFEPYFNDKKPRLEPNFSFDLCRLGCSLFDFIVDDLETVSEIKSPIEKIIVEWCKDDKGRNIMYKNNGDERYPEFKLYKMIARTVHNHVPMDVLKKPYFEKYVVGRKKINKANKIMNIDTYPSYE